MKTRMQPIGNVWNKFPRVAGDSALVKRRHGLNRSRYKGVSGMKCWVGLGVMADNMINIGLHLASRN